MCCCLTTTRPHPPKAQDRSASPSPWRDSRPFTLDGFTCREVNAASGVTVRRAVRGDPPERAEIVTAVEPDTTLVVTANVALLAPAATVTLAGTVAADVLSLDSDTTAPPTGAGPLSVTVPVEGLPPARWTGSPAREVNAGSGVTVRGAVLVTPP